MIYKGIEIDEDALYQETVDTILDIMAENPDEYFVKPNDFKALKKVAQLFVAKIDSYGLDNLALKDLSGKTIRHQVKDNIKEIREQYKLLATFAKQIDNFFDRQVTTLWVKTTGKKISGQQLIYELDETAAYSKITNEGRLPSPNTVKVEDSKIAEQLNQLNINIDYLSPVYEDTLRRYEIGQKKNRRFSAVLWKETDASITAYIDSKGIKWGIGRIYNRGDIGEAYVNALTHEEDHIKRVAPRETQIGAFYNYYITKVDSMAAVLGADVDAGNGIQYAIKAKGSRPPSLLQYYNVAKLIISMEDISAKDLIEEIKNKYPALQGTTRNKQVFAQTLAEITDDALRESLDDVIDKINLTNTKN